MFFSGDPASRRKIELRGRSYKESDRQVLLNKARDEREQRQRARRQQHSAIHIQKFYRGRKEVELKHKIIRKEFSAKFGDCSERAGREVFTPQSKYLPQLFYFVDVGDEGDIRRLISSCHLFFRYLSETGGNVVTLLTNGDYVSERGAINYRVNRLASLCLRALQRNRELLKDELSQPPANGTVTLLVKMILTLSRGDLPWSGAVIEHLAQNKLFHILRELLLDVQVKEDSPHILSSLEEMVLSLSLHYVNKARYMKQQIPFSWTFPAQILTIPLLWRRIPLLKQVSVTEGLWAYSVHQMALSLPDLESSLLPHTPHFPSTICLLGNILEVSKLALVPTDCTLHLFTDFATVTRHLIEELPLSYRNSPDNFDDGTEVFYLYDTHLLLAEVDEEMSTEGSKEIPETALMSQLKFAEDSELLSNMTSIAFSRTGLDLNTAASDVDEATAVGAVCCFLLAIFSVLQRNVVVTGLAYSAQLVPPLWHYMKRCYLNKNWPPIELRRGRNIRDAQFTPDLLGWMLPLSVFATVFSYLLISVDNDEFYEKEQPLPMEDIIQLISILKEALWQVLWVLPVKSSATSSLASGADGIFSFPNVRRFVGVICSRLLSELHDRNSRRQFAPATLFHAREAIDESFFSQAESEHSRARDLLRDAPFLIPFTSRVRIYTAQLAAARPSAHPFSSRVRMRVQRSRIIDDSLVEFSNLNDAALRGTIRVTFVNEFGAEEAGIDGGGMFKDFMETITKSAFDIQYGLFKETSDHLLYPNPASHLVHDGHLHYFEFLGKILGKAMFEGILVEIPFANFFLSKLRKKHNYLHDLPSLDPELYKNLLFLKNNSSIVSDLGLYFVIEENEYGEQLQVELLPGGKDLPVTSDNVFKYIHLVANHRLNTQIRQQSVYFLRGFQQLISPEWIDMFNEHELQLLISGSHDTMDVDDLRNNVNYSGGYHERHPVIEMFWEILKTLDINLQRKFLKFVTGCSRGPLLGFKYLEPQFCIQRTTSAENPSSESLDRLPTAATCMNLLKLPPYRSKEMIREKLLYAITADAGFDLS